MVDAAIMATTDASGGVLWHPATLQDIYDMPDRVLRLYWAYRSGQAASLSSASAPGGTIGGVEVK